MKRTRQRDFGRVAQTTALILPMRATRPSSLGQGLSCAERSRTAEDSAVR